MTPVYILDEVPYIGSLYDGKASQIGKTEFQNTVWPLNTLLPLVNSVESRLHLQSEYLVCPIKRVQEGAIRVHHTIPWGTQRVSRDLFSNDNTPSYITLKFYDH